MNFLKTQIGCSLILKVFKNLKLKATTKSNHCQTLVLTCWKVGIATNGVNFRIIKTLCINKEVQKSSIFITLNFQPKPWMITKKPNLGRHDQKILVNWDLKSMQSMVASHKINGTKSITSRNVIKSLCLLKVPHE